MTEKLIASEGDFLTRVTGEMPEGMADAEVHYTIAMPGYILEQGTVTAFDGSFLVIYDPFRLQKEYPNIDITAYDDFRLGLADQIWIAVLVGSGDDARVLTMTMNGQFIYDH